MTPGRKFWMITSALPIEAFDGRDVGRILEVGGEAELAAVDGVKEGRIAADLGVGQIEAAAEIAPVGPLDLDHPRAKIAEAERRERPRQELAHVEDEEPLKQGLAHDALLDKVSESGGVAIFHGLQVLAVHDELALALENLSSSP